MEQIKLAKTAGFCFGVNRAVNIVYELIDKGEKCCTLGPIIHNQQLVDDLNSKGVLTINDPAECPKGYKIVVRTHGVEKKVIEDIENRNIEYINATCPFVLKTHRIVKACPEGTVTLIAGDEKHPEVLGIRSYCVGESYVFKNEEELLNLINEHNLASKENVVCVCQTTFSVSEWKKCNKIFKKVCTNCKIFDTICNATSERQREAAELSKECDAMIIVGGRHSSNTCKLRDVCSENCPSYLVETANEVSEIDLSNYNVVGITAGASTPAVIIEEVHKSMSEETKEREVEATDEVAETAETAEEIKEEAAVEASNDDDKEESFAELLEKSFSDSDTSKIVKGVVVNITPSEVFVDVPGRKQTGVIAVEDLSAEPFNKPEDVVSVGDELNLIILRTNDQDGMLKLSKKITDSIAGWDDLEEAKETQDILSGKVVQVVRGGVLATTKGARVFIPASLSGAPANLQSLANQEVRFRIIDLDASRRKVVGSIKSVLDEERAVARQKAFDSLEVGQVITGTVKSLTSYGAFVDLGGIDGMIHISELSWVRIKHPSEVVSVGDTVEVTVKTLDPEKMRISLGFKKIEDNPWEILKNDYPIGSDHDVKIVGLSTFGAFANVLPGIDGLIHISQISWNRIKAPSDVLKVGDIVKARIMDVDFDKKRVSLSIKELLEKPDYSYDSKKADDAEEAEAEEEAEDVEEAVIEEAEVSADAVEETDD